MNEKIVKVVEEKTGRLGPPRLTCEYCGGCGQCEDGHKLLAAPGSAPVWWGREERLS